MAQKGKVWLVGAGPSDSELLTIKAKRLIESADVIVYDSLVGVGIIGMIPPDVEMIDVGKRAGNHTKPQEEINRILCEEALQGKNVVRLKGGDPFLFGRGGEELELLAANNIAYEIVPGVTSAISVPAYNGIPVTHRDFTSSVHIITGHKRAGEALSLPFEALVETNGTLVFLMGLSSLPFIMEGLMSAGMSKKMPAAVLSNGTTSKQQRVVGTIGTIEKLAQEARIKAPAIIVVGEVCKLAEQFAWYEKLPLFGRKMIVTRPKGRPSVLSDKLKKLGAEVVEFPSIKTEAIEINEEIKSAYNNIKSYDYILFTSPYGVKIFFDNLRKLKIDIRTIGNAKIAAIGSATKRELENHNVIVDYMPAVYSGEELGKMIGNVCKAGDKIFIPRAKIGNAQVVKQLKKYKNVDITDLAIYDTIKEQPTVAKVIEDFTEEGTYVLFTSASTVDNFVDITRLSEYTNVKALCIGEQTMAAASKYKMKTFVAKDATIDGLVELVLSL